jgi:hypothetical protein
MAKPIADVEITPNNRIKVTFQFLHNPEYLMVDDYIIINEKNLKVFGRVTQLFYDVEKDYKVTDKSIALKKRKNSVPPEMEKRQRLHSIQQEETKSTDD